MADDDTTKVILDLDNSEFVSSLQDSLGLMKEFGSGESLGPLADTLAGIGVVAGVVGTAVLAFKTALDMTVEAEKINQINTSFETLAASVGLSADKLKNDLLVATKGLVDETSLLQAANQAIVVMGDNASKIPEIMELARKASVVFGGSVLDNFNNLSMALSSGNAKMLRHYGIIVDTTKAEDDFAKSLGVGRQYLDDSGKKMAIMNAALEQGKEKFAGINESNLQTTQNIQKISVSFTELKEAAILAWDKVAGPTVQKMVSSFADTVHGWVVSFKDAFGSGASQQEAHREALEKSIEKIKEAIPLYQQAFNTQKVSELNAQLASQEEELAKINAQDQKSLQHKQQMVQAETQLQAEQAKSDGGDGKKKGIDYTKYQQDYQKFQTDISNIHKQRVDADMKIETDADTMLFQNQQKNTALLAAADAQWAQKKKQMENLGLNDKAAQEKVRVDIYQKANDQIVQNNRQSDQIILESMKNRVAQEKNSINGIGAQMALQSKQAQQDFMNMGKLGGTAFNAISSNATSAFKALGSGSKDAADAMKGFMFGAIGQIAEQQGQIMLLMGIWPPNPAALAAGAALIAIGAAISAAGNTSGGSSVSSGGSAGASASSATSTVADQSTAAQPTAAAPQEKRTVTVAIAGNYFETDQTRQALMQMIRQSGDFTDFDLKQIGTP